VNSDGCLAMSVFAASDTDHVELSEQEKQQVARRARRDLMRILLCQVAAAIIVALLFGLFSGLGSAASALLGAGCYLAPNSVFVARLMLATYRPQGPGVVTFLVGNALKVLVAIGLLWLLADNEAGRLDWLAALLGLIAALKGYWLGLLFSGGRVSK
jgi:ATP synthase protein I